MSHRLRQPVPWLMRMSDAGIINLRDFGVLPWFGHNTLFPDLPPWPKYSVPTFFFFFGGITVLGAWAYNEFKHNPQWDDEQIRTAMKLRSMILGGATIPSPPQARRMARLTQSLIMRHDAGIELPKLRTELSPPSYLEHMSIMELLLKGDEEYQRNNYGLAIACWRTAALQAERVLGEAHQDTFVALANCGHVLLQCNLIADAYLPLLKIAHIADRVKNVSPEVIGESLLQLAMASLKLQEDEQVECAARRAVDYLKLSKETDKEHVATAQFVHGTALAQLARFEEALKVLYRAQKCLANDGVHMEPPEVLIRARMAHASVLLDMQLPGADAYLTAVRQDLQSYDASMAEALLRDLASLYWCRGQLHAALRIYNTALASHPDLLSLICDRAVLYWQLGLVKEAEAAEMWLKCELSLWMRTMYKAQLEKWRAGEDFAVESLYWMKRWERRAKARAAGYAFEDQAHDDEGGDEKDDDNWRYDEKIWDEKDEKEEELAALRRQAQTDEQKADAMVKEYKELQANTDEQYERYYTKDLLATKNDAEGPPAWLSLKERGERKVRELLRVAMRELAYQKNYPDRHYDVSLRKERLFSDIVELRVATHVERRAAKKKEQVERKTRDMSKKPLSEAERVRVELQFELDDKLFANRDWELESFANDDRNKTDPYDMTSFEVPANAWDFHPPLVQSQYAHVMEVAVDSNVRSFHLKIGLYAAPSPAGTRALRIPLPCTVSASFAHPTTRQLIYFSRTLDAGARVREVTFMTDALPFRHNMLYWVVVVIYSKGEECGRMLQAFHRPATEAERKADGELPTEAEREQATKEEKAKAALKRREAQQKAEEEKRRAKPTPKKAEAGTKKQNEEKEEDEDREMEDGKRKKKKASVGFVDSDFEDDDEDKDGDANDVEETGKRSKKDSDEDDSDGEQDDERDDDDSEDVNLGDMDSAAFFNINSKERREMAADEREINGATASGKTEEPVSREEKELGALAAAMRRKQLEAHARSQAARKARRKEGHGV